MSSLLAAAAVGQGVAMAALVVAAQAAIVLPLLARLLVVAHRQNNA
jgi:hypothetical protein